MNSKILLLSVAVIAVGLFAMPSTLSLFAGQHTFYNGSSVNCAKCHQDIIDEIGSTSINPHYTIANSTDNSGRAQCRGCHTTGTVENIPTGKNTTGDGYNYSNISIDVSNDSAAHAAITVECISCHSGVPAELIGANSSHGPFYNATNADNSTNKTDILKGANEACVGCHTHAILNITWIRSTGYNMTVTEDVSGDYVIAIDEVNSSNTTTYSQGE